VSYQIARDWFDIRPIAPGIVVIEEPLHYERVKSYLISGNERAILFDTGMGVGNMHGVAAELNSLPLTVVLSHAHWDHIGDAWRFDNVAIHRSEADILAKGVENERLRRGFAPGTLRGSLPADVVLEDLKFPPVIATGLLDEGDTFELGGRTLRVLHTPGHSPGGVSLLDEHAGILLSADAAYAGVLYCHLTGSDLTTYRRTMTRLAKLAPSLASVLPSHNDTPMDPRILLPMRDGLDAIALGRSPDLVDGNVASHTFDAFSVLVPNPLPESQA